MARVPLAGRVRRWLLNQPVDELPVSYRQLTQHLELDQRGRIRLLGSALERLMQDDARAGRPLLAACVVSQIGRTRPAPGFFDYAVALGVLPSTEQDPLAWFAREQAAALVSIADAQTMRAYRNAVYRGHVQGATLPIMLDQRQPEWASVLACEGVTQAAFLTAWNPGSRRQTDSVNRGAQSALDAELAAAGWRVLTGESLDPEGLWPTEPARLVLGLGWDDAKVLAERYGQRAWLSMVCDGSCRLVDGVVPSFGQRFDPS